MNNQKQHNSQYTPQVVFLGIMLFVSFALAWLFIQSCDKVPLSPKIELSGSGLTIRMPRGESWNVKTDKWEFDYDGNYFFTGSSEQTPDGFTAASVRWKYHLCSPNVLPVSMQNIFAAGNSSYITARGITVSRGFGINWAKCVRDDPSKRYMYYGMVSLGQDRFAELEVSAPTASRCEDIFEAIVAQTTYKYNSLLSRGMELLDSIRLNENFSLTAAKNIAYYKTKSPNVYDGFIVTRAKILSHIGELKEFSLTDFGFSKVVSSCYILFDERNKMFSMRCKRYSSSGHTKDTLIDYRGSNIDITDLKTLQVHRRKTTQVLVPEIFEMMVVKYFAFNTELEDCMVDILMPHGQIIPVILKREQKGRHTAVKVCYTHKPESEITVSFNSDNDIIRIDDTDGNITTRSNAEELFTGFEEDNKLIIDFIQEDWKING
jgi:hypothetical protein